MTISDLHLTNFRSYEDQRFNFESGINLITGPNGSGKTNILEAIYMLGMTRSFRGLPRQITRHGEEWFRVEASLESGDTAAVAWANKHKRIQYNGEDKKPKDYIGFLPVVLFEPGSLQVVYGSPRHRRQLLDRILSFTDPRYLTCLLQMRRILTQRNSLLRQPHSSRDDVFGWDVLLVEQADYIRARREELLQHLHDRVADIYQRITGGTEETTLRYASKTDSSSYGDELLRQLEQTIDIDRKYGTTSHGPHRDDVNISYNGKPLANAGSQGEVRTAVVALVLAELEYHRDHAGTPPVLLLDDVFSELDETRQAALLEHIHELQTIITATHLPPQLSGDCARITL